MTDPVALPAMRPAQAASWHALMDLHSRFPDHWTLIGGQMVHLHCAERAAGPERPTEDADTVLDIRAARDILARFTRALSDLRFTPDTSGEGLQHRWKRAGDNAQIDVLLPDGVGRRAGARRGVAGAPTLETPGGSQALARSESVTVIVEGRTGRVRRPTLIGALVVKAAAHSTVGNGNGARHRRDFVTVRPRRRTRLPGCGPPAQGPSETARHDHRVTW
ncbi:MAG: hypothetical protein ACRCXL_06140 [Dermatophilaceae bacterium]